MCTFVLVLAILAVVLSPIAIDWFLTFRETKQHRQLFSAHHRQAQTLGYAAGRR